MCLVPDRIAGKSPGSPNPDEPIAFCLSQHISSEDEQDTEKWQHGGAHLEVLVAEVPDEGQPVHVEHEGSNQRDEQVKRWTELCDVRLERVNVWDDEEEQEHPHSDERHQEHAPEFGHVTVHLVIHVPVRCHLIGKLIP